MRSIHDNSGRSRFKRIVMAAAGWPIVLGICSLCQAQAQTTLRKIEVIGLQRLLPDQVIQSSGLRIGQAVDSVMIDGAANKLMQSGMFRQVSYRVRTADNDTTVIFEVEESPARNSPAPAPAPETLGQVRWLGNQVLSSQELSAAFAMKFGEPADRVKIDNGLAAVRKAYARKGYVAAHISEFRTHDALNHRIDYELTVREGDQYRMGAVTIAGLGLEDTRRLKTKWTLAPGSIFDDSYLDDFRQTVIRPFVAERTQRTGVRSKFDLGTKPDAQRRMVDVIITFK